ncbi:hypothetical protein P43SY_004379 [Pythium insidiosum]|uniref:Thiamin pyrophosphokinase thiamin-binding domain-containing protein n=1 Tax=Pythium insidiosum TaxID=114742 RepID=A0AAD5MAN2_PYTIN|nr:hypothetical protein P43SY_004379 [Pythium insidiosum]
MASSTSSSASSAVPEQLHSHAFWSDPTQAPRRLAVLLLNARHASWRIPASGASGAGPLQPRDLFWSLWSQASVTVCADGGANRLFDLCARFDAQDRVLPQYIKGDLDSLRADVRSFYAARGTRVLHDADQNTNDLDKCLQLLRDLQDDADGERFSVVIFGAMGGRFDQEIQNLNALFRWHDVFRDLVLLSEDTTARLLLPGRRHVIAPHLETFETRTCGLVPLAGACASCTTTGLKWDLDGSMPMGFGGLISTSNHLVADVVTVECSHPLVWTTEMQPQP